MAFFEGGDGSGSLVRVNPTRPAAAAKAVYSSPAPAPQVVANPDNQARPSGYARQSQTMAAASGRPPAGPLAKGGSSTPAPRNTAASPAAVRIASMLVSRIGRTSPFQNAGIAATRGGTLPALRIPSDPLLHMPSPLAPPAVDPSLLQLGQMGGLLNAPGGPDRSGIPAGAAGSGPLGAIEPMRIPNFQPAIGQRSAQQRGLGLRREPVYARVGHA